MTPSGKEKFFKNLAINSHTADIEAVKKVYLGLLKTIVRELKGNGECGLPEFGKLYLYIQGPRKILHSETKKLIVSSEVKRIRFKPIEKLREFVKQL